MSAAGVSGTSSRLTASPIAAMFSGQSRTVIVLNSRLVSILAPLVKAFLAVVKETADMKGAR